MSGLLTVVVAVAVLALPAAVDQPAGNGAPTPGRA